jgi:hypothetical protein
MEAARTSETSVDNYFTRQYIPEDNSELHTRRRENLKSQINNKITIHKQFYSTSAPGLGFETVRKEDIYTVIKKLDGANQQAILSDTPGARNGPVYAGIPYRNFCSRISYRYGMFLSNALAK